MLEFDLPSLRVNSGKMFVAFFLSNLFCSKAHYCLNRLKLIMVLVQAKFNKEVKCFASVFLKGTLK